MRHLLLLLTIFAWVPAAIAETFVDPATKVEITLPDGWQHDPKNEFGFLLTTPEHKNGIRIHLKSNEDKTLIEGLNSMARTFADRSQDLRRNYQIIGVREVRTASGTKGLLVTTGTAYRKGGAWHLSPSCWHYLFLNRKGQLLCVCLYNTGGITDAEADALILPNVRIK